MQSRLYDQNTGRFINAGSTDYLGANGDINSYNLFAYCSNNPVNYADPSGKFVVSIGMGFSAVCIGGLSYSISLSIDDDWNFGVQITEANVFKKRSGVVLGILNLGSNVRTGLSFDGDTIYDLEGEGFSVSGSIKNVGVEVSTSDLNDVSKGTNVFSISYGASVMPVDVAATASKTRTLWSFNIAETANNIRKRVVSWFR